MELIEPIIGNYIMPYHTTNNLLLITLGQTHTHTHILTFQTKAHLRNQMTYICVSCSSLTENQGLASTINSVNFF